MALVNEHFLKLPEGSLFDDLEKSINAFKVSHPKTTIIRMDGEDAVLPLCPAVVEALHHAVDEMGNPKSFHGYPPVRGYDFLREAILKNDFHARGVRLDINDIFVNDGAKGDLANVQELLRWDNNIGIPAPSVATYAEANAMIGRTGLLEANRWSNVTYFPCTAENDFKPVIPDRHVDMIYLCYPNNPTGAVLTKDELKQWVNFALRNESVIFFDATYEAFIRERNVPHSIYEIKGARRCAIEFRSFSHSAGFSGVRCGYTVIPKELMAVPLDGSRQLSLNQLWLRRLKTKSNGISYISQRGAHALFTPEGKHQTAERVAYYMENARLLREAFENLGLTVHGGENSPYVWVKTPGDEESWKFFDRLLYAAGVVCTPGICYGSGGEGYVRFSAFLTREDIEEVLWRMGKWLKR